ncbi:MAG: cysteine--tRNA ligase [Candidatus Eremiobacteraeota bacterium]|nr:cysteine--tRNA ligase [Candidatus Eremiobacteraeota bacterium]
MALRLYNSRTRSLEPFAPLQAGRASIYVCGMTPSFHPHLGHARTFLTFDVLRRHLMARGYEVTYVQNVTDIDDRIIERAATEGVPWDDIVSRYLAEYEACAQRLGLLKPDHEPRATREMSAIVDIVNGLVQKGAAYESGDGVYFAVEEGAFPHYGELSHQSIDELRAGVRVAVREDKRGRLDFALWKKAKPGEPTWPSPWGPGRPGWHIECSAMARKYLADQIDIHGGAADLIFPHHENEVAQTETYTGKVPMANFWVHAGLLNVDGQKMSKSLGNFTPLTQILDRYPAAVVRYLFLQTGYRKPSNFTAESIDAAGKGLRGLYADLDALRARAKSNAAPGSRSPAPSPASLEEFDAYLDDDLNTAGAVGWLQTYVKCSLKDGGADASIVVATAQQCLERFGLPSDAESAGLTATSSQVKLNKAARMELSIIAGEREASDLELVEKVISARDDARKAKDWAKSDRLRDALARAGIAVKDTPSGAQWSVDGRS